MMWNQLRFSVKLFEYITVRVECIPVHVGLSMSTVDDTENLSMHTNPVFLETTLSSTFIDSSVNI